MVCIPDLGRRTLVLDQNFAFGWKTNSNFAERPYVACLAAGTDQLIEIPNKGVTCISWSSARASEQGTRRSSVASRELWHALRFSVVFLTLEWCNRPSVQPSRLTCPATVSIAWQSIFASNLPCMTRQRRTTASEKLLRHRTFTQVFSYSRLLLKRNYFRSVDVTFGLVCFSRQALCFPVDLNCVKIVHRILTVLKSGP